MQHQPHSPPRRVSAAGLVVPRRRLTGTPPLADEPAAPPRARVSAAGIKVPTTRPTAAVEPPRCEQPRTHRERRELFDGLRALRDSIKPKSNKNELAIALVVTGISGGLCTKPELVGALKHLGLKNTHAGAMIARGAGEGRWRKGADGRYSLPR